MRKIILFLIPIVCWTGCQSYTQETETSTVQTLTTEVCQHLAFCIPDHTMDQNNRANFTEDFLSAWDAIYTLPDPSEYMGYMPDKEWIYYLVSGNGDEEKPTVLIQHIEESDASAIATFAYTYHANEVPTEAKPHTLHLVQREGRWLIDDYDQTKEKMRNWVANATHTFLSSNDWKKVFENDLQAMQQYQQAMNEYLSTR